MIMSRKEYDDIDRKAKEEEIIKIKDDPEALQKKIENLLSNERLTTQGKKLPPLAADNILKSNKTKEKKELPLSTNLIIQNTKDSLVTPSDNDCTNKNMNNTGSEIDIKDNENWEHDQKIPSYHPKLLEQHKMDINNDYNTFSLESNEFGDDKIKFVQYNNQANNEDEDYQHLIADLAEEAFPKSRIMVLNSGQDSTMDQKHNQSKIINQKASLNDSFDELVDEFGGDHDVPIKPKDAGLKMSVIKTVRKDSFDDFEF